MREFRVGDRVKLRHTGCDLWATIVKMYAMSSLDCRVRLDAEDAPKAAYITRNNDPHTPSELIVYLDDLELVPPHEELARLG